RHEADVVAVETIVFARISEADEKPHIASSAWIRRGTACFGTRKPQPAGYATLLLFLAAFGGSSSSSTRCGGSGFALGGRRGSSRSFFFGRHHGRRSDRADREVTRDRRLDAVRKRD